MPRAAAQQSAIAVAVLLVVTAAPARGQGFDTSIFQPATSATGFLSQDGAGTLGRSQLNLSLSFDLARDVLVARDPATGDVLPEGAVVSQRLGTQLAAAYGLGPLELDLALPVVLVQDGTLAALRPEDSLPLMTLGDVRLGAKLRLWRRERETSALGLAASVTAGLPTGSTEGFTSDGAVGVWPRAILGYETRRVAMALNGGVRLRGRNQVANLVVDDELTAGAALALRIAGGLAVVGEAYGAFGLHGDGARGARPAEALAGARYLVSEDLAVQAAVGIGLTRGYGAPSVRGLLSVMWLGPSSARRRGAGELATAGDGAAGRRPKGIAIEKCKDGKTAPPGGGPAQPGCPEPDGDADGIPDEIDRCPETAGVEAHEGCPVGDRDGDGLGDAIDGCADRAEDRDGYQDDDGCPDEDDDGDGVADVSDRCPTEQEDPDSFEDDDGCPDIDNDLDGMIDFMDSCPNEAEVFNGKDDDDGCPDKGAALVALVGDRIEIYQAIGLTAGKPAVQRSSHVVLETLAKILLLHPELKKIRVVGPGDLGAVRSLEVAETVRAHLVKTNRVERERLEAVAGKDPRVKTVQFKVTQRD